MPYLFDGYNLYHAAGKVCSDWAHITPLNLCVLLAQDMQRLKDSAVVVFDGRPLRGQSLKVEPLGFVRLLYSGPGRDADTLIAELIQANTAPRRLSVVSSDHQVRRAARRRRARTLSSPEYLEALLKRQQQPPPPPREPAEKRHGVPEGELDDWLELFGIDPDESPDDLDSLRF